MEGKIYTFCLPDIGEGVVEGEVVEWLKQPGDAVERDEPVVVVMTDKATVELPAPYAGTLVKQFYKAGEIAIKDRPLYTLNVDPSIALPEVKPEPSSKPAKTKAPVPSVAAARRECAGNGEAIPKVRRMAKELGIDLAHLQGTGKGGRVTEVDLRQGMQRQVKAVSREPLAGDESQQLIGVRGLMARRMHERHVPQFSYFETAAVGRLIQLRQNIRSTAAKEGINLTFMPFFIRALSMTAKQYPLINATVDMQNGSVIIHRVQNIGIAMASEHGLIVPVLKGVESMGLNEIIRSFEELKGKAVQNCLNPSDMKEATLTVSNFGVLGGEGMWATPMINEPETAIVALAKIRKAPMVKSGELAVLDVLPVSWSFDHRVIDGELAAHISHHFTSLLKDPAFLL